LLHPFCATHTATVSIPLSRCAYTGAFLNILSTLPHGSLAAARQALKLLLLLLLLQLLLQLP
jgi:hypothetical protein